MGHPRDKLRQEPSGSRGHVPVTGGYGVETCERVARAATEGKRDESWRMNERDRPCLVGKSGVPTGDTDTEALCGFWHYMLTGNKIKPPYFPDMMATLLWGHLYFLVSLGEARSPQKAGLYQCWNLNRQVW